MTDAENSDDERYANESFENESDAEVPEMSEFENESAENSDEDDENLPSVKANTGPINRSSYGNNPASINKTDVVPFASSSEEEDDVIVGQTLAEINTPSMLFEDFSVASVSRLISFDEEDKENSEEVSEEENDEEEELQKIKEIEEKYLQQIYADANEIRTEQAKILEEREQMNFGENQDDERASYSDSHSESEVEDEPEPEKEHELKMNNTSQEESHTTNNCDGIRSSKVAGESEDNNVNTLEQTELLQIIQSSITNLKVISLEDNETNILKSTSNLTSNETKPQAVDPAHIINPEQIALAVVKALKNVGLNNLHQSQKVSQEVQQDDHAEETSKVAINNKTVEAKETEIVNYNDDFEEEQEVEVEVADIQNKSNDNGRDIYCDAHFNYRITSKTPTSFNSDDYIFHANFIKPFHRTNSTDRLRAKPHPRKSMSFSNDRMREIERHNQILLRKILTQKPSYNLNNKPSQSSLQKPPSQTNTRLTTSALNRKKQQRQIDLDNQVLKRKIEAIALRRCPFIT